MTLPQKSDQPDCELVLIEWEDSTQPQGRWQWLSAVEAPKVVRCLSVGFLIRDTKHVKTLAPNLGNVDCDDDVQASSLISIPSRAVLRIVRVEEITSSCNGSSAKTSLAALSVVTPKKRRKEI